MHVGLARERAILCQYWFVSAVVRFRLSCARRGQRCLLAPSSHVRCSEYMCAYSVCVCVCVCVGFARVLICANARVCARCFMHAMHRAHAEQRDSSSSASLQIQTNTHRTRRHGDTARRSTRSSALREKDDCRWYPRTERTHLCSCDRTIMCAMCAHVTALWPVALRPPLRRAETDPYEFK